MLMEDQWHAILRPCLRAYVFALHLQCVHGNASRAAPPHRFLLRLLECAINEGPLTSTTLIWDFRRALAVALKIHCEIDDRPTDSSASAASLSVCLQLPIRPNHHDHSTYCCCVSCPSNALGLVG